jgi:hypothetical protein|tara:strand:- start:2567 stop:2950 length:384 start_codon:yes stop_codon:yes gene_type:complete
MSKRQERINIHAQLVNAGYDGGTANRIANNPNIHNAHKQFRNAMKNPPGKSAPAAAPAPPPAPKPLMDSTPRKVTDDSDGSNLKIKKKSRKRRQELSKGTGQLRINPSSTANTNTAGMAAQSGGINI